MSNFKLENVVFAHDVSKDTQKVCFVSNIKLCFFLNTQYQVKFAKSRPKIFKFIRQFLLQVFAMKISRNHSVVKINNGKCIFPS